MNHRRWAMTLSQEGLGRVYSAAQPGQISTSTLANYGANLPGYALAVA